MSGNKPVYDESDALFNQIRKYIRWSDEHVAMWELAQKSDVISWKVTETETKLNIPRVYHIEYRLRSIVGIDEELNPIFGHHHVMELAIPTAYPLKACTIYMKTNAWHPNIKSEGQFKGRVCGNVQNFGLSYTLPELVLRVGEMLQYKNYLAEFIPPYPEDEKVAKWVREVGEPRGIVNLKKQIFVDDTPLLRVGPTLTAVKTDKKVEDLPDQTPEITTTPPPISEPVDSIPELPAAEAKPEINEEPTETPPKESGFKIRILNRDNPNPPPPPREKIIIKPKD